MHFLPQKGITGILFEGYLGYKIDLLSSIIERFGVNLVWAPTTLLNMLKTLGEESVTSKDLSSLRLILNTGEPLNPGIWSWLREKLPNVFIADSYWMTEYGFPIACTPFGLGEIPYKPGSAGLKFFGVKVVDEEGNEVPPKTKGYIVLSLLNPAMARLWNDPDMERFTKIYLSKYKSYFYTGDFGYCDEDGYLYVLGRADDIILKEGERIGTMEVESILVSHPAISESAVVSYEKERKSKVVAFIVTTKQVNKDEILNFVRQKGYSLDDVVFVKRLPKTRSAKIMRRVLRALLENEDPGDVSALDDPSILVELKESIKHISS